AIFGVADVGAGKEKIRVGSAGTPARIQRPLRALPDGRATASVPTDLRIPLSKELGNRVDAVVRLARIIPNWTSGALALRTRGQAIFGQVFVILVLERV